MKRCQGRRRVRGGTDDLKSDTPSGGVLRAPMPCVVLASLLHRGRDVIEALRHYVSSHWVESGTAFCAVIRDWVDHSRSAPGAAREERCSTARTVLVASVANCAALSTPDGAVW